MVGNLSDTFRNSAGLDKIVSTKNPNAIAGFSYNVELSNKLRTQKKIFSNIEYDVGAKFLDLDTGLTAEVLSKEPIKKRDLL